MAEPQLCRLRGMLCLRDQSQFGENCCGRPFGAAALPAAMEDPAESERAFARHSRHSHDAEHEERASHDGIAQVRESVHHLADGLDTVKALVVQLIEVQQAQHGPGGRRSPTGRIDSALSAASPRWAEEAFWHSPTKAPAAAPAAAAEPSSFAHHAAEEVAHLVDGAAHLLHLDRHHHAPPESASQRSERQYNRASYTSDPRPTEVAEPEPAPAAAPPRRVGPLQGLLLGRRSSEVRCGSARRERPKAAQRTGSVASVAGQRSSTATTRETVTAKARKATRKGTRRASMDLFFRKLQSEEKGALREDDDCGATLDEFITRLHERASKEEDEIARQ